MYKQNLFVIRIYIFMLTFVYSPWLKMKNKAITYYNEVVILSNTHIYIIVYIQKKNNFFILLFQLLHYKCENQNAIFLLYFLILL